MRLDLTLLLVFSGLLRHRKAVDVAVAASDAIVTLPARIARAFAPGFGLVGTAAPL